MPEPARPAVVLLSGGLDSATTMAVAREAGFRIHAISFRYGQRHALELDAARAVASHLGAAEHRIVDIDLRGVGGSALTSDLAVPKDRTDSERAEGIPVTYVPARNTIFLAHALGWAEVLGSTDLFLGVNAVDYSGYPDCRPEFIAAFEALANLATRSAIETGVRMRIHAPLLALSKAEIIRQGIALGVDFGLTRSCYDPAPTGAACGRCDSCHLRLAGFSAAGLPDPAPYAA